MDLSIDFSNRKPDRMARQEPPSESTIVPPPVQTRQPEPTKTRPKPGSVMNRSRPQVRQAPVQHEQRDPNPIVDEIVRRFPADCYAWLHRQCVTQNVTQAELVESMVRRAMAKTTQRLPTARKR